MINEIYVKSVLNKTKRRDTWFLDDYTINPYSACSFNCLYCYIRGSKYGANMEEKLSVKVNAVEILERQLHNRAKKNQHGIIVLSSATDPYLPIEKKYQLTRQILERIHHYKFPVHILTKSDLVVRDFDLLEKINRDAILPHDLQPLLSHKVFVTFSFSTIDNTVGKIFEPGAPLPGRRIEALKETLAAGFHSGVSLMPLLPYITDTEEHLNAMFAAFSNLQVRYLFPASITLFGNKPSDSMTLMFQAIHKYYPALEEKYIKLFAYGHQPPSWYRNEFYRRVAPLREKYHLKDSIGSAISQNPTHPS
ncbi:radical SAM protein [Chryseolinea sp. H1M3-3]|uniref:SPL family radical SAM protein n=1 Tax=Chryseolinea sp. H1M3-3 TaxID=3034144 RepID=UPI0023EE0D05|nr:radical SAM protein [Chryseolinea sp. H1M3-3]